MILSIIIPCYNEEKGLPNLINEINIFKKSYPDVEFIVVNNGSTDSTKEILNSENTNNNFKIFTVKNNIGYGNGIKSGLNVARSKYIGWFHADNLSIFKLLKKLLDKNILINDNIFIKGLRFEKRSFLDKFFTFFLSFITSIILLYKFNDINAQPTIFERKFFANINKAPNDFTFDLYIYYFALKNNQKIMRIKNVNDIRKFGVSSWNSGIISRIKLSTRYLLYLFFKMDK